MNRMVRKSFKWVVLLLFSVVIFSCKSKKVVVDESSIKSYEVDTVFQKMSANQYEFQWLKGKLKGVYSIDNRKQNFSGQFRIRRDSVIWCSITAMNIEVIRVMVRQDSVFLLNRLEKTYFATTVDYINKMLDTDVDFDMLQALLLGNDIPYYEKDKFDLSEHASTYELNTLGRRKLKKYVETTTDNQRVLIQKIQVSKGNFKIIEQSVKQLRTPNKKLTATYEDFENIGGLFPTNVEFVVSGTKKLNISFKFSKVIKDDKFRFPFKFPSRYQKVEVQ